MHLAIEKERAEEPYALVTVIRSLKPTSVRAGAKAIVSPDGRMTGFVGGQCTQSLVISQARECLANNESRVVLITSDPEQAAPREGVVVLPMTCHSEGTVELFIEPKLPARTLLVIGNSPIASHVAEMGERLNFNVKTIKWGTEIESKTNDSDVTATLQKQIRESLNPGSYVVVATMGLYDEHSIATLEGIPLAYAGLVTSPKRWEKVLKWLKSEGVSEEFCSLISAPAGLDLGAVEPAEIAVTILAEMIQVKRSGKEKQQTMQKLKVEKREGIDPVCHMVVDLNRTPHIAEYKGETYGFCCSHCRQAFLKDPEAYLLKTGI